MDHYSGLLILLFKIIELLIYLKFQTDKLVLSEINSQKYMKLGRLIDNAKKVFIKLYTANNVIKVKFRITEQELF